MFVQPMGLNGDPVPTSHVPMMVHGPHGHHGAPALIPAVEEHKPNTGCALVITQAGSHAQARTLKPDSATKMAA